MKRFILAFFILSLLTGITCIVGTMLLIKAPLSTNTFIVIGLCSIANGILSVASYHAAMIEVDKFQKIKQQQNS
jgi:hypothetical protein